MLNTRADADARQALSGKDGALFNDSGTLLATVDSFQSQANLSSTKYHPLGAMQEYEVNTGFGATLTFTHTVVEDDAFIQDLFAYFKTGQVPDWSFQGVLQGRNGSEQRVIYRNCIPSGSVDLQNISTGDIIKRAWTLAVNSAPDLQSKLTSSY